MAGMCRGRLSVRDVDCIVRVLRAAAAGFVTVLAATAAAVPLWKCRRRPHAGGLNRARKGPVLFFHSARKGPVLFGAVLFGPAASIRIEAFGLDHRFGGGLTQEIDQGAGSLGLARST